MRVIGQFNNISKELKEKIVPLRADETVEYQICERVKIQDPVTQRVETRYPQKQFWAKDTIFDPYLQTVVDIGVPAADGIDIRNGIVNKVVNYSFERPRDGILLLDGRIAVHRELHEFFQICNFIEEGLLGEHRDSSKEVIFRRIDKVKAAKRKSQLFDAKADAIVFVRQMDNEDMVDFAAAMNWDYKAPIDEIIGMIKEYADSHPIEFKKEAENPITKKKAIIKKAIGTAITYDPANHRFLWKNGAGVIANLVRKEGENEVTAFANWINTVPNGEKILSLLRNKKQPKPETVEEEN